MSGVRQGSHLEHLLELRDRVDEEIAKERVRAAAADARRAELDASRRESEEAALRDAERARRAAEKEAEREERREAARAAREQAALERLAEVDRIEAAAPTDLVRAWARDTGIPVGDRGRIPLDLRKQYLAATGGAS